jgi:hypothetical protein
VLKPHEPWNWTHRGCGFRFGRVLFRPFSSKRKGNARRVSIRSRPSVRIWLLLRLIESRHYGLPESGTLQREGNTMRVRFRHRRTVAHDRKQCARKNIPFVAKTPPIRMTTLQSSSKKCSAKMAGTILASVFVGVRVGSKHVTGIAMPRTGRVARLTTHQCPSSARRASV